MIKSLVPRFQTPSDQDNDLLAEAAPKAALAIWSNAASFALLPDILIALDIMVFSEVDLERIATEEDFGALLDFAFMAEFMAAPGFNLVVLGILVAFPVVFAAKLFIASGMRAAIRARVALLVLSTVKF